MAIAIGIDVHKKTSTFFAYDEDGEPLTDFNERFKRVKSDREGYSAVLVWLGDTPCDFLLENSTKTHDIYWILKEMGYENLYVAHSVDLKRITKSDKKNDRFDAEKLATYMRVKQLNIEQFRTCYICTPEDMRLRRLCRIAKEEMFDRGRIVREIRSHLLLEGQDWPGHLDTLGDYDLLKKSKDPGLRMLGVRLEDTSKRIGMLKKEIENSFEGNPIYLRLREIPQFGWLTAAYLASIIADIERFDNAKKLSAYIGLVPRQRDSGESENHCGITHTGDPVARWLVAQATFRLVNSRADDSALKTFFEKKNGGSIELKKELGETDLLKLPALVAAANKLMHIIYALLKHPDRHW